MAMYSRHFVQCSKQCDELKLNELYKVETFSKNHVSIWVIDKNGKENLKTFSYDHFYDAELYRPYLIDNNFQKRYQPLPTPVAIGVLLFSALISVLVIVKLFV